MTDTVLILGAGGRFGRAAVTAFHNDGWQVRALRRTWPAGSPPAGVDAVSGDGFDAATVARAAAGCDVIVNALNPPYHRWRRDLPRFTASVIAAARDSGATVMLPGNVYNYGAGMPARLTEDTPHRPTTRKGRLREELEQAYAGAAGDGDGDGDGVRTVIVRAGDFIDDRQTGNWFESHIAARVDRGRVLYPGPLDCVHAWAWLPDLARAMAALATVRASLPAFATFGFAGYTLTGRELIASLERGAGRSLAVNGLPWPLLRLAGLVSPVLRETVEMAYLWRTPHAIDGTRLAAALPGFRPTPVDRAIAAALAGIFATDGLAHRVGQPA